MGGSVGSGVGSAFSGGPIGTLANIGGIVAAPFTGGASLAIPIAIGAARGGQKGGVGGALGGALGGTAVAGMGALLPGANPFGASGALSGLMGGGGVVGPGVTSAASGAGGLMSPSTAWSGMNSMQAADPTLLSSLKGASGVMSMGNMLGGALDSGESSAMSPMMPQTIEAPQIQNMVAPNVAGLYTGPGSVGYSY